MGHRTLRDKMNRCGRYALQCFTPEREKRAHPESWRGGTLQAQLSFKGLFVMGRDMVPVLEPTHAIVQESKAEICLF